MADVHYSSPLRHGSRGWSAAAFALREIPEVTKVRAQVLRNRGAAEPITSSSQLPVAPNSASGTDPFVLWRAPDDWLVCSRTLTYDDLAAWISGMSTSAPLIITDVSSASVVLELKGSSVLEILMRDCTLDLEGNAVPPGACARTLFAHTNVMIHRHEDNETWWLFVERSVALHVCEWLLDSAGIPSAAAD